MRARTLSLAIRPARQRRSGFHSCHASSLRSLRFAPRSRGAAVALLALLALACNRPRGSRPDTGVIDLGVMDTGGTDAARPDAFVPGADAFVPEIDAARTDSSTPRDAFAPRDVSMPSDAFVPRDAGSSCAPLPTTSTTISGTIAADRTYRRATTGCGPPSATVGLDVFYATHVLCNTGASPRSFDFGLVPAATGGVMDPFVTVSMGTGDVSTLACITSDDDSGGIPDSLATGTIPAGATITVIASTYDDGDTGDYVLTITAR